MINKPKIRVKKLNKVPMEKSSKKYPRCWSGSRKISENILKIEYEIKKIPEVYPGLKINFFLRATKFTRINKTTPSRIAS